MRLVYIANVRLPTEKAHGLQIMKMCEAFGNIQYPISNIQTNPKSETDTKSEILNSRIEVELVVPRRRNPIKVDPFEYYGVERNFKITRLPTLDIVSWGKIGFWLELICFLVFARIYLIGKKRIIYTREAAVGFFFPKSFLELHTLPSKHGSFRKKIWQKAGALFVLTSLMKTELLKWGIAKENILVLPDAVDVEEFDIAVSRDEARRKLGFPLDKKIVLYTGSFFLYPWKGVDVLLEAAQKYPAQLRQDEVPSGRQVSSIKYQKEGVLFVLVGGSEKEITEAKERYTSPNILFLGYRPHADIPYYLKAADALVLPNKSGYEMSEKHTSPLKLFEYMASGRPIVSSDLPSLREILSEEEAVFFKPNDSLDLTRVIGEVFGDTAHAERISKNARAKAGEYTWEKRATQILDFI